MFIGQLPRRLVKPECISAQMLRARARSATPWGHSCFSGKRSARYSAMASVSQTARSPSTSTGTLATGLMAPITCLNCEVASNESKRTITSSKGMPACVMSTQGRMDHDE
ncbi:hypothetical protein D9M68_371270 [compost metagenome]